MIELDQRKLSASELVVPALGVGVMRGEESIQGYIPIPGAKNARQASQNAGAFGWRLTQEEHMRISQAASRS